MCGMKIKWCILVGVIFIKVYYSLWIEGDGRGELSRKIGDIVGIILGVIESGRWYVLIGWLKF